LESYLLDSVFQYRKCFLLTI